MDCCNYMPYRQSYCESPYYDPLVTYHTDYYHGQQMYDYYGASPYYHQQWQCAPIGSIQDYVYNPKEARIRKAMREATRDRSIGASPMLPRPSARRPPSHGWPHDEPSMIMSPLNAGVRGGGMLESPVCFPILPGNNQFLSPFNGYGKMDVNSQPTYLQNPLAQLQQRQTEMWHSYQDNLRPRSIGNSYLMDIPYGHPQSSSPETNSLIMEKPSRQTNPVSNNMPLCSPHSNENVPPEQHKTQNQNLQNQLPQHSQHAEKTSINPDVQPDIKFEIKASVEPVQPLMECNNGVHVNVQLGEQYYQNGAPGCHEVNGEQQQIEKVDRPKTKKQSSISSQQLRPIRKPPNTKPLPDFNEAFGSTERGRFQSPPDPRLAPNKSYVDYFFDDIKFEDYHI